MRINHSLQNPNIDIWVFVGITTKGLKLLLDKDGLALSMDQEVEQFKGDESEAVKEAKRRGELHTKRCRLQLKTVAYLKVNFEETLTDDLIRRIDRIEGI